MSDQIRPLTHRPSPTGHPTDIQQITLPTIIHQAPTGDPTDSPPVEDQIVSFSILGWGHDRIAAFLHIPVADVKKVLTNCHRSVKSKAIRTTEKDLIADLMKLQYLEKHLFAQLSEKPQMFPQYLKLKDQIEVTEKALKEIVENSGNTNQSDTTIKNELLKLKLQKEKGELVVREDVDNVLDIIVTLLQSALQQIKSVSDAKECRCFSILLSTVSQISTAIENSLEAPSDETE